MSARLSFLAPLTLLTLHGCDAAPSDSAPLRTQSAELAPATGPVTLVTDLNVTSLARQLSLSDQFTRMGGSVYFSATGTGVGQELWRTDGTPQGTTLVRDIIPGPWGHRPLPAHGVEGAAVLRRLPAVGWHHALRQ
ncbi:conserved hypothetical protein [Myxococcus xanthus DK 1622]|uniref:Uncharacterized protein n=1 Tax=Myxococcus xanthus (strain DK1622) TaxID=246197 RepID=Q1DAH0_MYXXD|nr:MULTISPECIES: hypothetical protein [Myxococcus]ABF87428.1 conserved hypothetical protein [Myxococcus xanthus DK 1622]NOJ56579.1 hypothetical protein [Myxococcus xanthus]QPM81679.1 hypothetical protein I5Q59_10590 [Myxococcus xanthus]QVW70930.1 hypothetical protein JTM82_15950 [Myxococcus xanthus DZ2]QZZ49860.1 hypothetical protein MyxoNM_11700 [Myxococcus xanthus]